MSVSRANLREDRLYEAVRRRPFVMMSMGRGEKVFTHCVDSSVMTRWTDRSVLNLQTSTRWGERKRRMHSRMNALSGSDLTTHAS